MSEQKQYTLKIFETSPSKKPINYFNFEKIEL